MTILARAGSAKGLARAAVLASGTGASACLSWRRTLLRQFLMLAVLAMLALLLRDRLRALDPGAVLAGFYQVGPWQWAAALAATGVSFWALGHYDGVLHHALATGQSQREARRAGAAAIAISQTLGFGLISGALVRWRMMPGLGLIETSRITAAVAASFLAGWALVTSVTLLILPVALPGARGAGALGVIAAATLVALSLWHPVLRSGVRLGRWRVRLPSLPVIGRILAFALIDTAAAAAALWVLMPAGGPGLAMLYPAFLLALGAGFVSGTPGGVGPFEVTLLMLLPGHAETPLLAAILAWRAVYFALPATLGGLAVALARPGAAAGAAAALGPVQPPAQSLTTRLAALVAQAPQAELGLLRQGEHGVFLDPQARAGWMIGRTPQALVGLLDPFGAADVAGLLAGLRVTARAEGRITCLYKISARSAARARQAHWAVAPVALEAWLDPREFDLASPERAGLRRKLRKAVRAQIAVSFADPSALPLAEMAAISTAWAQARGGERGFSMGRFSPCYIAAQRVYLAHHKDQLIGFASFHQGGSEWVLDLMRTDHAAPDGTMQALIHAAIAQARAYGLTRLSLAALPPRSDQTSGAAAAIWRRAEAQAGTAGLRQFKAGFAPNWQPLYIAAPSRAALALAAADIARAIRHPAPLPIDYPPAKLASIKDPRGGQEIDLPARVAGPLADLGG